MINTFIDRPVLASVLAILIVLVGLIALVTLPIAQYPEVVPPQVQITATYRGANAQDLEKTVTQPIEQQLVAIDDMLYLSSSSSNDGSLTTGVTFEVGTDLDLATVKVQNKEKLAEPLLPPEVAREGVSVKKVSTAFLQVIFLTSPEGRYDSLFLSNFAKINLLDRLGSLPGVGEARISGEREYGMRVWLNPDKLAKLGLTPGDVRNAILQQNRQNPAGTIGQPPARSGIDFQYPVNAPGRLLDASQFADIVVRAQPDGSLLRVRDVGRVELGAVSYSSFSRLNGDAAIAIIVYQSPGANAVATAQGVQRLMEEAKQSFPAGVAYTIPYDTTKFVRASLREVVITLLAAILLVIIVVFVFLQNWRATLIPLISVPVSLIGTFAFFYPFGLTINMTTLFALVLAIGIVVDDAIVVVEAVQRHIDDDKMGARDATIRAMEEVAGPVIAIALILAAVFIPVAFLGGITGRLYRSFALTIAISVLISALNALTLSPALSALLLRPVRPARGPLGVFYRWFNGAFGWFTGRYLGAVRFLVRRAVFALVALAVVCGSAYGLFRHLPTGFLPDEDQGALFTAVRLPDAASLERTGAVLRQVEGIYRATPGVAYVITLAGFDITSGVNNANVGTVIASLTAWDERKAPDRQVPGLLARLQPQLSKIQGALVFAFGLPPILGLGNTGGFEFEVEDRTGGSPEEFSGVVEALMAAARQRPELVNVSSPFRVSVPQLAIKVDRDKIQTLGIPPIDVYDALQTYLGGLYVNDFNQFGRTWRVLLQAEPDFRRAPEDIRRFYVRTQDQLMVPLSTLVEVRPTSGPEVLFRYNHFRAAKITGAPAPGYSSGQANQAMEEVAAKALPEGYAYEWTGTVLQQKRSEGQEPISFGLSSVVVLLLLAALYESWSTPFAVILAVPLGLFGALLAQTLRGYPYDVYTQIGIVTLIGLAAKNAILIVEFAKLRHEEGLAVPDAAVEAAHIRLRPILMTSFAFILGVVPLLVATGAGAGARRAIGTAVFGGMSAATMLAIFIVPVLFATIVGLAERGRRRAHPAPGVAEGPAPVRGGKT